MYRLLILLCCVALKVQAEPVAWGQPNGAWQSLSSTHFQIHYPQQLEPMARQALSIAEQAHQDLVPFFGQAPLDPTQLVLVDDYDLSNGWATPVPFNQIRLFAHAPEGVDSLEQMDSWLSGLIRHEYVHILHLNLQRGGLQKGNNIFGRLPYFFPHALGPSLFSEGLAVYLETNTELGYGRLAGSYYPMQMRAEVQEKGADSLNHAILNHRDWPQGRAYLYGSYFWQFIAETYGEEKIQQYLHLYSGYLLPYFLQNQAAKRVFGISFTELWPQYQQWLDARFAPTVRQKTAEPLPVLANSQQVTFAQGNTLWQVRNNGQDRPQLGYWQLDSAPKFHPLAATKGVTAMAVNGEGAVAVVRQIARANGSLMTDVFIWQRGRWQPLTKLGRFSQVRWLDNQHLLASRQQAGRSELWQLSLSGEQQRLWHSQEQTLGSFALSEGGQLMASLKTNNQGWDLARFDFGAGQWQWLTQTKAIEHQVEFLDEENIVFSADYEGVFNIYQLNLISQQLTQLTATQTGAFQPRLVGEQLFYQEYRQAGFVLMRTDLQPVNEVELAQYQGSYHYPAFGQPIAVTKPQPYSPWPSILPTAWLPMAYSDEVGSYLGASIYGTDALNRHNYALSAALEPSYQLALGQLSYSYDNRWQLAALQDYSFYGREPNYVIQGRTKALLARHHLWDAIEDQLQLHLGVSHEERHWLKRSNSLAVNLPSYRENLAGVALSFDNREYYRQVPGVGRGSYAQLVYESYDLLHNDLSGYRLQGQWQQTFDLPKRDTFSFTLRAGTSSQTAPSYELGGNGLKDEDLLFGANQYRFAGYRTAALQGQHYYYSELSYQPWLARIERNLGFWPVGLGDVTGKLWVSNAAAWEDKAKPLNAVGAALTLEVILGYNLVAPLSFALAHGLDANLGQTQGYVQLGLAF